MVVLDIPCQNRQSTVNSLILGPNKVSLLVRWPLFRGDNFCSGLNMVGGGVKIGWSSCSYNRQTKIFSVTSKRSMARGSLVLAPSICSQDQRAH